MKPPLDAMVQPRAARFERHPLSAAWPDMAGELFNAFSADLKKHGQREPAVLYQGKILDGWHRYLAWLAGECSFDFLTTGYKGTDPVAYVISMNGRRRSLTPQEIARATVACHNWSSVGRPKKSQEADAPPTRTTREMADMAGVSTSTIDRAKAQIREDQKKLDEASGPEPSGDGGGSREEAPPPRAPTMRERLAEMEQELEHTRSSHELLEGELNDRIAKVKQLQALLDGDKAGTQKHIDSLEAKLKASRSTTMTWMNRHRDAEKARKALEAEVGRLKARLEELESF